MAVVTKISKILELNLPIEAKEYLKELLDKDSETCARIFALEAPSFVRHEIGGGVYAIEQTFVTKDRENCFYESHRKFIDIQIVLKGRERIELMDMADLVIDQHYDGEKDLVTYKMNDAGHHLNMGAGAAAIFRPDDAHMCVVRSIAPERVFKTVLKVPFDMLNC